MRAQWRFPGWLGLRSKRPLNSVLGWPGSKGIPAYPPPPSPTPSQQPLDCEGPRTLSKSDEVLIMYVPDATNRKKQPISMSTDFSAFRTPARQSLGPDRISAAYAMSAPLPLPLPRNMEARIQSLGAVCISLIEGALDSYPYLLFHPASKSATGSGGSPAAGR